MDLLPPIPDLQSLLGLPADLGLRVDKLAYKVGATHEQCHISFDTISQVDSDIDDLVTQVIDNSRGGFVTALFDFWAGFTGDPVNGTYLGDGVADDAHNAQHILTTLAQYTQGLADNIHSLVKQINTGLSAIAQIESNPLGIMEALNDHAMIREVLGLYNALGALSALLSGANNGIVQELSAQMSAPRICASGVRPGDNASGPPVLNPEPSLPQIPPPIPSR